MLTEGAKGMKGAIAKQKNCGFSQVAMSCLNNLKIQPTRKFIETTGPEIWKDTDGKVDVVVAGVKEQVVRLRVFLARLN